VRSALSQSYPVTEIIICDDGSTDNSKELITQLGNEKVIWLDCGKNGGPAVPRNKGILRSKGEWLAFLDSDDEWKHDKIEKQIEIAKTSLASFVCCNATTIRQQKAVGSYLNYHKNQIAFADLIQVNFVICSSVLLKKAILPPAPFFPEQTDFIPGEDYALWLKLATQNTFAYLRDELLNYEDNAETSIRSKVNEYWKQQDLIFGNLKDWIQERKVNLSSENRYALKQKLRIIQLRGQPDTWQRIKNRIKRILHFQA
jgi:glycosyltransferase involved in cell wall biosynthesis